MIHKTAYPHNFDKAFLTFPAPSRNQHSGGFAFEVQLSLTEKGQYAVAYDLSPARKIAMIYTQLT
ncbi:TPA: hypothetical protein ACJJ8N_001783, partial [Neisseria meningitidis]